MIKINNLLFKPASFFHFLKKNNSYSIIKVLLWGFGIGALSQFILFLLNQFLLRKNTLIGLIDTEIFIVENYSKIKMQILLREFVIYIIIIPIITILLRIIVGFILTKILGLKNVTFLGISKIICFSMISNFLMVIPMIGIYLGCCYLFFLLSFGCKIFFETKLWQAFVFALPLIFISFQPLFYVFF